jgi:hypothetical protein
MTPIQLATLLGNVLTQVDSKLSDPALPMSDPNWQTLYALRKHLADLQRALIQASIAQDDPSYLGLTKQISDASTDLQTVIKDAAKVNAAIAALSQIAAAVDQVLKLTP